jgi:hypothetical protein
MQTIIIRLTKAGFVVKISFLRWDYNLNEIIFIDPKHLEHTNGLIRRGG